MSTEIVNPILPEFLDKLDPQFVEIYNREQASRLRADQVTIDEYRANPTKYTLKIAEGPKPETGSAEIYNVDVQQPDGEIKVKVYTPTKDAIEKGGLKGTNGLPVHVNYHGGKRNLTWYAVDSGSLIDSQVAGSLVVYYQTNPGVGKPVKT
jgi:acetyl esterase/lipase